MEQDTIYTHWKWATEFWLTAARLTARICFYSELRRDEKGHGESKRHTQFLALGDGPSLEITCNLLLCCWLYKKKTQHNSSASHERKSIFNHIFLFSFFFLLWSSSELFRSAVALQWRRSPEACVNTNSFSNINRSSHVFFFFSPRVAVINGRGIRPLQAVIREAAPLTCYSHHTHPTAYRAIKRAGGGDFGRNVLKSCDF